MTPYEKKQRQLNWKLGVAALVVSLLLHQLLFFGLQKAGIFDEPEKEKKMKVSLLEEPKPKPKKAPKEKKTKVDKPASQPKPPAPKPKPTPKPKPVPKPEPLPPKPPVPQPPVPQPQPVTPPVGPQLPSPPATEPNPTPPTPPKLQTKLNWGAFERTMGETAAKERIAYEDESMRKRGGGFKFGKMSARVARSIQDRRSWVAGAPKEPLGAKSDVFRSYLEATHDQIHALFAESFLPSLVSLGANHPLNDFSLMTLLEFRILADGSVDDIHVIKTSGQAVFDAAPVDTLYRASPFLPPPPSILSYDNSVYFRWGFYRNQRKCGTFNATGYILKGPAAAPTPIPTDKYRIIDG
ncbi:MAG: energy transducer TonB [Deltaproteobacteria bacterium]|nr:energy transducer TonB [Deltaproteobacteria bacterium]